VGLASGEEPHLLVGNGTDIEAMAFSPDGKWLAVADKGGEIRLWPVPEVRRTPMHLKPHAELLAALRSRTNLRAVADPASTSGYKLEPGPFPGWDGSPGPID
jgi:WD40 repeat protein